MIDGSIDRSGRRPGLQRLGHRPAPFPGNVARTGLLGRGPRSIRLEFDDPCPYDVFMAAIGGFRRGAEDAEFAQGGLKGRDGFR